jgi:glycosyltransferase involved in cell wall biosynthesis
MKKITWVTSDCFIDVDLPVIPKLSTQFNINFFLIIDKISIINHDILLENNLKFSNVLTNIIKLKNRIRSPFLFLEYVNLVFMLKREKSDLYYINFPGLPYFLPLLRLFLGSKKMIIATHNVSTVNGSNSMILNNLYMKFTLSTFDNFHVFSENQRREINNNYNNKNLLYAPLALKNYGKSDKNKSDLITFLNFGIISRYKRVDVLINAAVLAYEKTNLKFIVKIAGRCKNWDSYQSLIKYPFLFDLRIESIPNEEVADLFASSHYFVLPYQDITQSGALMVALNYNLPVLASNVRSFSEFIVDGRTGFLFETASVNSLSNLIVHILENHKTIYQFLKLQQKKFVDDNFSIDTIVNKYSFFFNKIINENSRSC